MSDWKEVVYADECPPCPDCGEPWCVICNGHYADCSCIGPTEDEDVVEYKCVNDVIYGRRR